MTPSVKIRLGNLFDGASDLIVLPCSTGGTITGFVAQSLNRYSIPHPTMGMELGHVEILLFEGGENIAQFVAFAASVEFMTSSTSAIERIGFALGEFTKKEASVRIISAPLLGAGAGGLQSKSVVAALKKGFVSSAHEDSTFNHLRITPRYFQSTAQQSSYIYWEGQNFYTGVYQSHINHR